MRLFFHDGVKGSGVARSENRETKSDFTGVRDEGAANVYIKVGSARSVKVEGDDNIVPLVTTKVSDGVLIIKTRKSFKPKKKLLVTVTMPSLENVQLDGSANITAQNVNANKLEVGLDGAGNLTLSGRANSVEATLNGAGNIKLLDLNAADVSATVDGAGDIDVWATASLKAEVNGVGNINYKGSPKVSKQVDGVGHIGPATSSK
jgi:hypothetical protein